METESSSLTRVELLLIDDDPGTIQVLRRMLSHYPNVRFATDGKIGVELALDTVPDLILLDYDMPGTNGVETFAMLRENTLLSDVPVIFVTSRTDEAFESEVLNLGAADYIRKPPNTLVVNARVRTQLRLKLATDQLRSWARRDGLTGLANRRAFDETYEREWRRCVRSELPLSVIMIDVDHFKRYNDSAGHLAGDEALRLVARCLGQLACRGSDLPARFGGEEFVILLPSAPPEAARALAEIIRSSIDKMNIPHPDSPTADHLTASLGVSTLMPGPDHHFEINRRFALLQSADEALYRSKRDGRNRVSFHAFEPSDTEGYASEPA